MLFKPKIPNFKSISEQDALQKAAGNQPTPPKPIPDPIPQPAPQVVSLDEFNIVADSLNTAFSFLESYKILMDHSTRLNEEQKDLIKLKDKRIKSLKEDLKDKEKEK